VVSAICSKARNEKEKTAIAAVAHHHTAERDDIDSDRAVLVNVAAQLIPTALATRKQIEVVGTEQPVYVAPSADLVLYAVRNLVENAIAYSGNAPSIEIEVNPDGNLRVIDYGPGIAADMIGRVFDRFWRGQRSGEGSALDPMSAE
jgi:signal transduction histidine kinase